jgi:hypothetical protein
MSLPDQITRYMSLREPQAESLQVLHEIADGLEFRGNEGQSPIRVRVARVLPTFLSDGKARRGASPTHGRIRDSYLLESWETVTQNETLPAQRTGEGMKDEG